MNYANVFVICLCARCHVIYLCAICHVIYLCARYHVISVPGVTFISSAWHWLLLLKERLKNVLHDRHVVISYFQSVPKISVYLYKLTFIPPLNILNQVRLV
jgi:hypothetical protein